MQSPSSLRSADSSAHPMMSSCDSDIPSPGLDTTPLRPSRADQTYRHYGQGGTGVGGDLYADECTDEAAPFGAGSSDDDEGALGGGSTGSLPPGPDARPPARWQIYLSLASVVAIFIGSAVVISLAVRTSLATPVKEGERLSMAIEARSLLTHLGAFTDAALASASADIRRAAFIPVASVAGGVAAIPGHGRPSSLAPVAVDYTPVSADALAAVLAAAHQQAPGAGLPTRAADTLGYEASALYIEAALRQNTTFDVQREYFDTPLHVHRTAGAMDILTPMPLALVPGQDFSVLSYGSNATHVDTTVGQVVSIPAETGCQPEDYAGLLPEPPAGALGLLLQTESPAAPAHMATLAAPCSALDRVLAAQAALAARQPDTPVFELAALVMVVSPASAGGLRRPYMLPEAWRLGDPLVQVPVMSVSSTVSGVLLSGGPLSTLSFSMDAELRLAETFNLVVHVPPARAASPDGRTAPAPGAPLSTDLLLVGAHLDSVPAGPGLNDNASGSAALLELVLRFHAEKLHERSVNPVRFAWWGAEETGLFGSRYHVRDHFVYPPVGLGLAQQKHTGASSSGNSGSSGSSGSSTPPPGVDPFPAVAYVNLDMLGSLNGLPMVYTGTPTIDWPYADFPEPMRNASTRIGETIGHYFGQVANPAIPFAYTPLDGGSDYLSFLEAGVPSSGLATGAGSLKTPLEADLYGGFPHMPYDACYHRECDVAANVSTSLLEACARAVAFVTGKFATHPCLRHFLSVGDDFCPIST
ncbi:hypothetical protein H696_04808 [Fonticula alba]|uniref:Peptidase M28 domain-containing protein n=1 Tax=Fonticula alba TaxID=691883 RepID=A0A058Z338_FONAL|nr:hypothetical protein H696_04808 [Fonticula alba]KCV68516.1 hypothetical protein H696_04808 [Fonticula alba]|eukprot:XP_009496948.1 hypothetical protein H696_04808 [Fonticula alba]